MICLILNTSLSIDHIVIVTTASIRIIEIKFAMHALLVINVGVLSPGHQSHYDSLHSKN